MPKFLYLVYGENENPDVANIYSLDSYYRHQINVSELKIKYFSEIENIWKYFDFTPESLNVVTGSIGIDQYATVSRFISGDEQEIHEIYKIQYSAGLFPVMNRK